MRKSKTPSLKRSQSGLSPWSSNSLRTKNLPSPRSPNLSLSLSFSSMHLLLSQRSSLAHATCGATASGTLTKSVLTSTTTRMATRSTTRAKKATTATMAVMVKKDMLRTCSLLAMTQVAVVNRWPDPLSASKLHA